MGNKGGRQKSQEQGEGDDTNQQADDTMNITDDQSDENKEAATKTAEEQTRDGDDKATKNDEENRPKPTEESTTVNKKEDEQISGEIQKHLVEQKESELKEQATVKGDTFASETKTHLAEKKHIDSQEKDEEQKIVSSEVHDDQQEPAVEEEQQVSESTKESEAVPQQEEKLFKEIPSEEASSEQKEQPESCGDVSKDEVLKADEVHAEAQEQVKVEGDQLESEVREQEQVADSIKKSKTVPEQEERVSKESTAEETSSEQKEQLESFGEVSKDEVLKADERRTEFSEQVKVEGDQQDPEVREQEQVADSIKKSKTVPEQEENLFKEIPGEETLFKQKEQLESFGELSKYEVLKANEGHTEASEQVEADDDQLEPAVEDKQQVAQSSKESESVHQKEEKVSEEILAKEEATHAQGEHSMVASASSKEADVEDEKAKEASRENADTKPDKAGGKEEGEYAEECKVEGIADTTGEQPVTLEFRWEEGGEKVLVAGSFRDWNDPVELKKKDGTFAANLDLLPGEYLYKFLVDGKWCVNRKQPIIVGDDGIENNVIVVKQDSLE